MKATFILVILYIFSICIHAQEYYCPGNSVIYLNSHNISASTVANKPIIITGNIDLNVKFVVVDTPVDSYILVTILGQGKSQEIASSISSSITSNNGLHITVNKDGISSNSDSSSIIVSSIFLFPSIFLSFLFGKRSMISFLLLSLAFTMMVNAINFCDSENISATVIISLPNNFAFSESSFNVNNGEISCDTEIGLFAPICNSLEYNPMLPDTLGPNDKEGKGYTVKWLSGGIYIIFDGHGIYNTMFVVTSNGVILVDSPPSLSSFIKYAILSITSLPVKYVIYSHMHTDHIGASNIWSNQSDFNIIAHQEVYDAIVRSNSPFGATRLIPTITFSTNYSLSLGNETLEISYLGIFHSPGDTIIYSRAHKIIQIVDIFTKSFGPFRNLFETVYVQGYFQSHDIILKYDFNYLVGGHMNVVQRSDIEKSKELVSAIRQAAIDALNSTAYPDPGVDKNGVTNPWIQFSVYLDRAASTCANNFRNSNAKYFTEYSGLDVFLFSYCDNMVRSMRLE